MTSLQATELFDSFVLLWEEARSCTEIIDFSTTILWKDLIPEGLEDTASELEAKVSLHLI